MRRILSGRLNNKGVTLITLIIAITIFGIFITVFSYVMVAKHGSSALYVQSTQAYAVAQAGIEYGIRYATDNGYGSFPINDQPFGNGSFTLDYIDINDPDNPNALKSTGTVGVAEREIILQNFAGWVAGQATTLVPGNPPKQGTGWGSERRKVYVHLMNNYNCDIYIYEIKLAKKGGRQAEMEEIRFGGTTVWREWGWGGRNVSNDPDNPTDFSFNQVSYYTMVPGSGSDNTLSLHTDDRRDVDGTWYCTFLYSKQSDLSDPQSSLVTFYIP